MGSCRSHSLRAVIRNDRQGPAEQPSHRGRILIVEDLPALRIVYRRMLEREYSVDVVASGGEALARLGVDRTYDVIVCDLMLPDMDGRRVHASLCEFAPQCASRMLFCTGDVHSCAEFFAGIGNPVLEKPCTVREMLAAVERVIARHGSSAPALAAAL